VSAGIVLAATLLPLCVFAAPLRLQLGQFESSVKGAPALSAKAVQKRTNDGLKKSAPVKQRKVALVPAKAPEADVVLSANVERTGKKAFRLVYALATVQEPKLTSELTYELTAPKLADKNLKAMVQDILAGAEKLEEERKTQAAAPPPAPEVAAAPTPAPAEPAPAEPAPAAPAPTEVATTPAPAPATPEPAVTPAPAPETPKEVLTNSAPVELPVVRHQPLVVIHTGIAGLYVPGSGAAGFGAVVEPKWNITDYISAGLRLDGGVSFGGKIAPQGTTTVSLGAGAATLAKGEFFLGSSGVRPFFGLGAGMYLLANQSVAAGDSGAGASQSAGNYFGVAPQLGIDFGGVRLAATYNHILGADVEVRQEINAGATPERIQRNYVQLELSFRLARFGMPPKPAIGAR
jgi:hypothetical protein